MRLAERFHGKPLGKWWERERAVIVIGPEAIPETDLAGDSDDLVAEVAGQLEDLQRILKVLKSPDGANLED